MATPEQELRNLTLVRGGRYARPCVAPEIALERTVRERMAALMSKDGKALRESQVYNIAEGRTHPTRPYARLIRKLKAKRISRDQVRAALIDPLEQHLDDVYGRPAA